MILRPHSASVAEWDIESNTNVKSSHRVGALFVFEGTLY